jgi:hypothetical protein
VQTSLCGRVPWYPGIGRLLRAWFKLIELFSHGRNSELVTEDGARKALEVPWGAVVCALGSAMMSVMRTTGVVLTGSEPMSKEGRAGGERLTVCSFDPSPLARLYSSRAAMSYLFCGEHEIPLLVNTEVIHVMEITLLGNPGEDVLVVQENVWGDKW